MLSEPEYVDKTQGRFIRGGFPENVDSMLARNIHCFEQKISLET